MKLVIWHKFPSLNEYIAAERTNRYKAAKLKKEITDLVALACKSQKIPKYQRARFRFVWICKNKKMDPDNVAYNCKGVFDGMVHAGVLPNDGWDNVKGIVHDFEIGADYGVEIEIEEA